MDTLKSATDLESKDEPRLEPIEHPKSIKLKLAYWLIKKKLGKVITPVKVVQARMPDTLSLSQKLLGVEDSLSLPNALIFYIKSYVATLNGCSFCIDIAKAQAENDVDINKYEHLLNYQSSAVFSDTEKAALQYVEQTTLEKQVEDAVFEELQTHYSEREVVEITWLNAMENYYNLINRPLRIASDNLCNLQP